MTENPSIRTRYILRTLEEIGHVGNYANAVAPEIIAPLPLLGKSDTKPTWCPGCGDYGVVAAVEMALKRLKIPSHNIVVVSGIGCSSNLPHFLSSYGFHQIHGRALPVAEGIRWANHALTVIATGGDGDGFGNGPGTSCMRCGVTSTSPM